LRKKTSGSRNRPRKKRGGESFVFWAWFRGRVEKGALQK